MKSIRWLFAGVILALFSSVYAGQSGGVTVSHYEPLQRLSVQAADATRSQKLGGTGPAALSFDALGQTFEFQLEPNSGFLSPESRGALPDGVAIYRGRLAGKPDSWARIVVFKGMPSGLFWDGNQLYAIEAPGDSIVQSARISPI